MLPVLHWQWWDGDPKGKLRQSQRGFGKDSCNMDSCLNPGEVSDVEPKETVQLQSKPEGMLSESKHVCRGELLKLTQAEERRRKAPKGWKCEGKSRCKWLSSDLHEK